MNDDVKPGWKTTELLVVVIGSLLSIVVAAGYFTADEAAAISNSSVEVINALAGLVGALAPIIGAVAYIWSRTKIKVGK